METLYNILDEIDLNEKEMLNEANRKEAAEILMLDPMSYDALKYELGIEESKPLEIYHGYKVVVSKGYEKCIRFV